MSAQVLAQTTWGWCHVLGWTGLLWHLALWAAIAGLLVWLVVSIARQDPSRQNTDARAALDERLARGELTPEEYRERREALR